MKSLVRIQPLHPIKSGHGASGNTYPCQGQVASSILAARSIYKYTTKPAESGLTAGVLQRRRRKSSIFIYGR